MSADELFLFQVCYAVELTVTLIVVAVFWKGDE